MRENYAIEVGVVTVCELIENEKTRELYGKNSVKRANDFTEEEIMKKWISILEN